MYLLSTCKPIEDPTRQNNGLHKICTWTYWRSHTSAQWATQDMYMNLVKITHVSTMSYTRYVHKPSEDPTCQHNELHKICT